MSEQSREPRPPKRKGRLDIPVDPGTLDRARKKAGSLKKLRAVVRAFLDLWSDNEMQGPPEEAVKEQERRAQKRKKQKPPPTNSDSK